MTIMSLKAIVQQVIHGLIASGQTEFTADEVYERIAQLDPNAKRYSVFSFIQGFSKGSRFAAIKEEEKILEKTGRGRYRLAPPPPPPTPKRASHTFLRRTSS
jgi:hypothetical protein